MAGVTHSIALRGLAVVMAEDAPDVASANPNTSELKVFSTLNNIFDDDPAAWNNLCPHYSANDPDTQWE